MTLRQMICFLLLVINAYKIVLISHLSFFKILIVTEIKTRLPEVGDLQRSSVTTVPSVISHRPAERQNKSK